jgi:hypothetical protein
MTIEFTAFSAETNGFRFANSFVTPISVPVISPPTLAGLCGGMSFSTLDHFNAGVPIPTDTFAATGGLPPTSSPLYRRILERHIESLGLQIVPPATPFSIPLGLPVPISVSPIPRDTFNVVQFVRPNFFWTTTQLTNEVDSVMASVRLGKPVSLGLVAATSVLQSHVVVATGFDDAPPGVAAATDLLIYDCRFPMKTCTLRFDRQSGSCVLTGPGLAAETWKALFVEHYTPVSP